MSIEWYDGENMSFKKSPYEPNHVNWGVGIWRMIEWMNRNIVFSLMYFSSLIAASDQGQLRIIDVFFSSLTPDNGSNFTLWGNWAVCILNCGLHTLLANLDSEYSTISRDIFVEFVTRDEIGWFVVMIIIGGSFFLWSLYKLEMASFCLF